MTKSLKAAVIGAGLSGLTAAYRLQQLGIGVELYEAHSRVGGRIFTIEINGHLCELGAQNILNGASADNFLSLAQELKLEFLHKPKLLNLTYCAKEREFSFKELLKAKNYNPSHLREKLEQLSLKVQSMQEVLDALFQEGDLLNKICSTFLSGYEGSPPNKLSTYYIETLYRLLTGGLSSAHPNLSLEQDYFIDQKTIKGGNGQLPEKLASRLQGCIHLNHALISVNRHPSGAYALTFRNRKTALADILLLTIPPPAFQDIDISAEVIPKKRQEDIASLQFGSAAKILTPLAPPGAVKMGEFTNGHAISFLNLGSHIVNLYCIGETACFNAKTVSDVFQQNASLAKKFQDLASSQAPVLAEDKSFASYNCPVAHSWTLDPYIKGSYSCIGAGQEKLFTAAHEAGGERVKALFSPIGNTLFFAGEHTTLLLEICGTMEAAVESGERAARMVRKLIL